MVTPEYLHFSNSPDQTIRKIIDSLSPDKVAMLVDENTKEYCLPLLSTSEALVVEIKSGEQNKNLTTCETIWEQMTQFGMSRKSLLINLGGGVIGDMGGFAASIFKRGIRFVNMPTTLLSMVDASIGGKLGIDFNGLKNHIGLFANPEAVIVSPDFLKTLPKRQLHSGFAEVLKHALISDADYWNDLRHLTFENVGWNELIKTSITIKSRVVSEDPHENGSRKILNFGHSFGHAIETHFLAGSEPLLHGEAIAIGMLLEAHISVQKEWLDERQLDEIQTVLKQNFLFPELPALEYLLPWMKQDKKNQRDALNFSLIKEIGECAYDVEVSSLNLTEALEYYTKIR